MGEDEARHCFKLRFGLIWALNKWKWYCRQIDFQWRRARATARFVLLEVKVLSALGMSITFHTKKGKDMHIPSNMKLWEILILSLLRTLWDETNCMFNIRTQILITCLNFNTADDKSEVDFLKSFPDEIYDPDKFQYPIQGCHFVFRRAILSLQFITFQLHQYLDIEQFNNTYNWRQHWSCWGHCRLLC